MPIETVTFDSTKHWRFEDLAEASDDVGRYEIGDGVLEVTPPPVVGHDEVVANLATCLTPQLPPGLRLGFGTGVLLGDSYRVPDLCVLRSTSTADEAPYVLPGQLFLAAEVVSAASRATDRLVKPAEYASGGIPVYLRIERAERVIVAYELPDGGASYRILGTFRPGQVIELREPLPLDIDVAEVLA